MPRKSKNIVELEVLENIKPEESLVEEEPEEIQASKQEEVPIIPPAKKERKKLPPKTAKQLEVMHKGREIMMANAQKRRVFRAEQESIKKIEMEKKIVTKAIAIKKKQIKQEAVLELSDDDDDAPVIQKTKKHVRIQERQPEPPQFIFV